MGLSYFLLSQLSPLSCKLRRIVHVRSLWRKSMADVKEQLLKGLNNAYAMEEKLEHVLRMHADDAKDNIEIAHRLEDHADQSNRQAQRLKECIESLDGDVSKIQKMAAEAMGHMEGMMTDLMPNKLLRNTIMDYVSEHMEIGTYTALVAMAQHAGEDKIASVCEEILGEEEDMAEWVYSQIPDIAVMELADD